MVAEPGRRTDRANQIDQRLGLVDIGNGFQGEHVGARAGQDFQPRPMPSRQSRDGQAVTASVLGPIGQRRAVRAYRCGDGEIVATHLVASHGGEFDAAA